MPLHSRGHKNTVVWKTSALSRKTLWVDWVQIWLIKIKPTKNCHYLSAIEQLPQRGISLIVMRKIFLQKIKTLYVGRPEINWTALLGHLARMPILLFSKLSRFGSFVPIKESRIIFTAYFYIFCWRSQSFSELFPARVTPLDEILMTGSSSSEAGQTFWRRAEC